MKTYLPLKWQRASNRKRKNTSFFNVFLHIHKINIANRIDKDKMHFILNPSN